MNFIENILRRLEQNSERVVLREVHDGKFVSATGGELLALIHQARMFIRRLGLRKGDRCGLLAPHGIRWVAIDLALMAEGVIVVPLYSRQAPNELVNMLKDSGAAAVICGDETLRAGIADNWIDNSSLLYRFTDIFDVKVPDPKVL